jgi:hypothetical protein
MKGIFITLIIASILSGCSYKKEKRIELSLNGTWDIARTDSMTSIPGEFPSKVQVPGLVDLSKPSVDRQDTVYENSIYWYRKTFTINNVSRDVIWLKINKARYHTRVFINRKPAGENVYNFTPSVFDIRPLLNKGEKVNEIIIAVGCKNNLPDTVTNGWDFEKIKYIPGIYDDVKIIMADYPFVENIQTVPSVKDEKLRVVADISTNQQGQVKINYTVREAASGKVISTGRAMTEKEENGKTGRVDFTVPMNDCNLWSPENPFLYDLELSTKGDRKNTRFGMRSFEASRDSGVFLLNGRPYYMRGTNVCIYRFFEDPERGNLPWKSGWVAKLHSKFKEMHWTSIRYCIGFPPERWYEIADSLGFLIQDEYPLWTLGKDNFEKYLGQLDPEQLAAEYREWMRERWNHPCVVVWDAQNESITEVTGKAIKLVRHLDLSDRPWDNGWAPPASESDAIESHPYLFSMYMYKKPGREGYLKELFAEKRIPGNDPNSHYPLPEGKRYNNPIILNEYGWIWLNRNGTTTTLTDKVYENVFPESSTSEKRLETYAKNLAILTEYWRGNRKAAAVMHFCGLGYSRPEKPRGQTSDHFIDIKNLDFEPGFYKYVRPAFSPVGIMISFWETKCSPGDEKEIPVNIINDTYNIFRDSLRIRILKGASAVRELTVPVEVAPLGRRIMELQLRMPGETGKYIMEASLLFEGETITSRREFEIR